MHARGQLDDASFHAGRAYQKIYETAELAGIPAPDLEMPRIMTRCIAGDYARVDARRHVAELRHAAEAALHGRYGDGGVALVRDILGRGMTIEACAIARGDGDDKQAIRFWGSFFRRCLRSLAEILGFATGNSQLPPTGRAAPGARAVRQ